MNSSVRKLFKLIHLVQRRGYRRAIWQGVGAAVEHEDIIDNIPFDTLIDVGANIGQFSLLARVVKPQARVHAFEPLRAMADKYQSLFKDDAQVTLYRYAAGEEPGNFDINVSASPDSSSLLPITEKQNAIYPGTNAVAVERVEVKRADDVLAEADLPGTILIKLDVQGFELSALKGMPKLLERASYVYAEVSFVELYGGQAMAHEIVAWLADRSFRLAGVNNLSSDSEGRSIQADFLFARA